jgi:hypothetical protein
LGLGDLIEQGSVPPSGSLNVTSVTASSFVEAPELIADGSTGTDAHPARFMGISGATGAPSTGAHSAWEVSIAEDGGIWLCTVAGTPGTWIKCGGGGGALGWGNYKTPTDVTSTGLTPWQLGTDGLTPGFDYSGGVGPPFTQIVFPPDSITMIEIELVLDISGGGSNTTITYEIDGSAAGDVSGQRDFAVTAGAIGALIQPTVPISYVWNSALLTPQTGALNIVNFTGDAVYAVAFMSLLSVAHP